MNSNIFCITSFFENEFEYANELYTNRIYATQMYPHRLNFFLYSYHNQTSHSENIHEKGTFLFYKFLGKIYFKYANELNTRPN